MFCFNNLLKSLLSSDVVSFVLWHFWFVIFFLDGHLFRRRRQTSWIFEKIFLINSVWFFFVEILLLLRNSPSFMKQVPPSIWSNLWNISMRAKFLRHSGKFITFVNFIPQIEGDYQFAFLGIFHDLWGLENKLQHFC